MGRQSKCLRGIRKEIMVIEPYAVVALSPRTFQMKRREDALENTKRICRFMDTAIMVGAWEGFPVRLVVIPEMAIRA